MTVYGIATLVQTPQERIDWYMNEFKTQPDSKFGGGVGKVSLLAYLLRVLYAEDAFFNSNIPHRIEHEERWSEFIDDCVAYACLYSYLNNSKLPLLDVDAELVKIHDLLARGSAANESEFKAAMKEKSN